MKLNLTKFIAAAIVLIAINTSTLNAQSAGTDDAILQGFYWNTHPGDFSSDQGLWWDTIASVAPDLARGGIQTVWTPPANKGFAGTFDMGYGVYDYYDFGSFFQKGTLRTRHGNASQLFNAIDVLHQQNLKVMGDLVLNHRAGAEETQPEECDHQNDNQLEDRFTKFRPASGRAPMNAQDFHPTNTHCDLFGPYHDRVFFEDLCYFEDIDQVLDPMMPNDGWYHGPHNLGRAGDSLIVWGRYLLDEVGFDELRLDAVKHIEPGFMAPFLVEMAAGDQPFAVGELFDGDIGTLKGYRDQVEAFNTTFGTGSKNANLAIFDFNLRFAIRDFCNNTSGGYDMWNLNNAGLLFNGMPGEDIVNFVENHDFDRIGYVQTDCSDPDVVTQEGSTCLKFSIDSGHDPVIFDKHLGYAYITAAEGRPSIFWKDWFWFGLKEEIKWQLALRSEMASGSTTPIQFLNPFFIPEKGNGGDMFVLNRNGNNGQGGLVLAINDNPNIETEAFVNTPFANTELKDYSDAYMFTQTAAFGDSRASIKASPRNYAWYAPTGHYPTPPDAEPTAFTLGNHQGAKLHFIALRAEDAANLLVNGAPIEVGDQIAVRPAGGGDAVSLGRIGQSFEWDGTNDMIFEVLGGGNASEAKGGLLNGQAFELLVFDKSTGTTEVVATLDFAVAGTNFTFNPLRPSTRGGSFNITTTHDTPTYQVGAISLITAFDTRPEVCVSSDAAASAYDDNWQTGDTNGAGFGNWTLTSTTNSGHFMASSTGNGDGDNNGNGDIDTGGRAWGMFANSGGQANAIVDFSQPLAQGQTLSLKMDNGFVNGSVGFNLQNAAGATMAFFHFVGGSANYSLNGTDTGVGYTDEGLEISLTLTSATDFEMLVTRLEDGSITILNGVLNIPASGTQQISRLFLFNNNAGFNAPANLYFNSIEICSTPACPLASVNAGVQSICNPVDNTYSQEVTVNFNTVPADGQLSVNGTTVPLNLVNNAQAVTLTGLIADGNDVELTVVLTGSEACTLTEPALFIAPLDCQSPEITCPETITVDTDAGQCSATVTYVVPEGTDNLPGATTVLTSGLGSSSTFQTGTNTEMYTVTDAAGNTASCSFDIIVNDTEAPTAVCPADITVGNGAGQCGANVNFSIPDPTDNCSANSSASLASGSFFSVGTTPVTVTATDGADNQNQCTFNVTVNDTENPEMVCRRRIINIELGQTLLTEQVDSVSTDNCEITQLSIEPSTFNCENLGFNTVTLTGIDAAANASICTATVNVIDNSLPTPACDNPTVNLTSAGITSVAASFFDGGSTAGCGTPSFSASQTDFDCNDVGITISVNLTVIAPNGQTANCTSMVTVTDDNSFCCAPANAVCNNTTVMLDASGSASIMPSDVGGGSTADCGLDTESVTPMNFSCSDVNNPVTVTYTIEDENGATSSCTAIVTVVDNIAPSAACLSNSVFLQADGTYNLQDVDVLDFINSNDNCVFYQVTSISPATVDCDDLGMTVPVMVTIEDGSGNTDNCTANVTVNVGDVLPGGWSANDIGNSGTLGNEYSFDPCIPSGGEFSITGGGNNATSSTTDNVAFASQFLCGQDVSITAKIESVTPNGYGGLMIRETTAAGSKQVAIFSNLTYLLRHETRYTTNGPKQVNAFYKPAPFWLRLQRMGDWIFAYYSNNGVNFSYVHGVFVPMSSCVEVGLASFTYIPGQQTNATFSNVSIIGTPAPNVEVPTITVTGTSKQLPSLYPNPTRDMANLVFEDGLDKDATIILRNPLGQVVEQRQLRAGDYRTEWDVATLADGLYLFEIRQEGEAVQVLRLVKTQ
jgi:hypothetical protein